VLKASYIRRVRRFFDRVGRMSCAEIVRGKSSECSRVCRYPFTNFLDLQGSLRYCIVVDMIISFRVALRTLLQPRSLVLVV
jgi:hypothetical protein